MLVDQLLEYFRILLLSRYWHLMIRSIFEHHLPISLELVKSVLGNYFPKFKALERTSVLLILLNLRSSFFFIALTVHKFLIKRLILLQLLVLRAAHQ